MIKAEISPSIYDSVIESMRNDGPWRGPKGFFYLLYNTITPYKPFPTIFRIETDQLNKPIEIYLEYQSPRGFGNDQRGNPIRLTTVATNSITTMPIQLGRGLNKIKFVVEGTEDVAYVYVRASSVLALWESFARVLFTESLRIIDEQKNAIYSQLGTRLFQPYLGFSDLLPEVLSLQTFAARLITRSAIHNVAGQVGVSDFYKALTLSTPIFHTMDKEDFELFPALDPWTNAASSYAGQESHVWIPNVEIASWQAFIKVLGNQPDLFEIISVSETEVVFKYQNVVERHEFDFDAFGTDYLLALAQSECFKSIYVSIFMHSEHAILICAPSYTFDLVVTEENPIGHGRLSFDRDIPFDSGIPFDSDDVDPFTDGWVGLSLTGRFEQDIIFPLPSPPAIPSGAHPLDSFVMPSFGFTPNCSYEKGYYTQVISNRKCDVDLDAGITAGGEIWTGTAFVLVSPDSTKWLVRVNEFGVLQSESGTSLAPANFRVTKPDLTEATFAIDNSGVVTVVSPPPSAGDPLNDALYVLSTDAHLWLIRVNNSDELYTTLIV